MKKEQINRPVEIKESISKNEDLVFPVKTVNDLARLKFKEKLLKEIMVDLIICKIEGFDEREYITELRTLVNEIKM